MSKNGVTVNRICAISPDKKAIKTIHHSPLRSKRIAIPLRGSNSWRKPSVHFNAKAFTRTRNQDVSLWRYYTKPLSHRLLAEQWCRYTPLAQILLIRFASFFASFRTNEPDRAQINTHDAIEFDRGNLLRRRRTSTYSTYHKLKRFSRFKFLCLNFCALQVFVFELVCKFGALLRKFSGPENTSLFSSFY